MNSATGGLGYSFQIDANGRGPVGVTSGVPGRRPGRCGGSKLSVVALIVWGFGMVLLTQWLHPAGPIEDPLITQEQLDF